MMFEKLWSLRSVESRVEGSVEARVEGSVEMSASSRWTAINTERRLQGCKCGAPNTHVRYAVGGVPCEIWTCEEHVNVNGWDLRDGKWVPTEDFNEAALRWVSSAHRGT